MHQIDINSLVQTKHEALEPFEYGNAGVEYLIKNTKRITFMREEPVSLEDENHNPGIYTGQWAENVAHLSKVYRNEMRHGRGQHIGPDGSLYEGYWFYDKMHGSGRKIYPDGTVYQG